MNEWSTGRLVENVNMGELPTAGKWQGGEERLDDVIARFTRPLDRVKYLKVMD